MPKHVVLEFPVELPEEFRRQVEYAGKILINLIM